MSPDPGLHRWCDKVFVFTSAKVGVGLQAEGSEKRVSSYEIRDLMLWNDKRSVPGIPVLPTLNTGESLLNITDDTSQIDAEQLDLELKKADPTAFCTVSSGIQKA